MSNLQFNMVWYNVDIPAYRIVQCFFGAITIYLLSLLLRHLCRHHCGNLSCFHQLSRFNCKPLKKRNENKNTSCAKQVNTKLHHRGQTSRNQNGRKLPSRLMLGLVMLSTIIVLVHVMVDTWVLSAHDRSYSQIFCIRQTLSGLLYFLSAFCVYLFLWIRQRMFFSHPVLRQLYGSGLVIFSWSVLISIILSMITFLVLYFIPHFQPDWKYFYSSDERTDVITETNENSTLFLVRDDESVATSPSCFYKHKKPYMTTHLVLTFLFLYFQISLQLLFAYPVCHHSITRSSEKRRSGVCKKPLPSRTIASYSSSFSTKKPLLDTNNQIWSGSANMRAPQSLGRSMSDKKPSRPATVLHPTLSDSYLFKSSLTGSLKTKQTVFLTDCDITNMNPSDPDTFQTQQIRNIKTIDKEFVKNNIYHKNLSRHQSSRNSIHTNRSSRNLAMNLFKSQDITKQPSSNTPVNNQTPQTNQNVLPITKKKMGCHVSSRLRCYVIRCFITSLICCISDLLAFGFSLYTQTVSTQLQTVHYFSNSSSNSSTTALQDLADSSTSSSDVGVTVSLSSTLAYNGNMVINLFCLVLCYDDWRDMLFPCFVKRCARKIFEKSGKSPEHHKHVLSSNTNRSDRIYKEASTSIEESSRKHTQQAQISIMMS